MTNLFPNPLLKSFKNLGIRDKLLILYSVVIITAVALTSAAIYSFIQNTIESNIESELQNSTTTILNMVRTAAAVSMKNYLRAVAEKNREILADLHGRQRAGTLSEAEAKERAAEVLLAQTIGKSGYIYCIDSSGVLVVHPKAPLRGVNISEYAFAREQMAEKRGYLEYDWKNPGELQERPKALYMIYFEPWDWIISASSYRKEFHELVNVDDFRESVLSLRFGETGYSYVIDMSGNLIIHPKLEKRNIRDERDADGRFFIREILRRKSGKIVYPWRNPGETVHREKLVIFNPIPEFDWIVASSSYLQEFYAPLRTVRNITIAAALISLIIVLPLIVRISSSITTPLGELMHRLKLGARGDFSVRMARDSEDEVGQLADYFNSFMARLETYSADLKAEIGERRQAEAALKRSEEMFFKAFNASPNAIAVTGLSDGRFIAVNDGFQRLTGYRRDDVIGKSLRDVRLFDDPSEYIAMMREIEKSGRLRDRDREIDLIARSGEPRTGVLSAEVIELWGEACLLSNIADLTETKRLQREIMAAGEKERQRIGQDLHDDLSPHLIGIEALTKVLAGKLATATPAQAELAGKIRELITEAIAKTRSLTRGLLPVHLVAHGLEFSLRELTDNTQRVHGIACRFRSDAPVVFNDNAAATHLYYIVQEALHNAVKHAAAGKIEVHLRQTGGRTAAEVTDDGVGIPEDVRTGGMGLRIMGYRAKIIDATLEVGPAPGGGTRVSISFRKPTNQADIGYG